MKSLLIAAVALFSSISFATPGDILNVEDIQVRAGTPRGFMRVLQVTAELCDHSFPFAIVQEAVKTSDNSADLKLLIEPGTCSVGRPGTLPVYIETALTDLGLDPATAVLTIR